MSDNVVKIAGFVLENPQHIEQRGKHWASFELDVRDVIRGGNEIKTIIPVDCIGELAQEARDIVAGEWVEVIGRLDAGAHNPLRSWNGLVVKAQGLRVYPSAPERMGKG